MFKKIYNFGINNATYPINKKTENGNWRCPIYKRWKSMMARCYGHDQRESLVSEDWMYFMDFHEWCSKNYVEEYSLDKDIILPGNNIYGPDLCAFVPRRTNSLLTDSRKVRGSLPIGVCKIDRPGGDFQAYCGEEGRTIYLGLFFDKFEAHKAWQNQKILSIKKEIEYLESIDYPIEEVILGLKLRINFLQEDIFNKRETIKL